MTHRSRKWAREQAAVDEANRLRAVIAEMVRLLDTDGKEHWLEAMMLGARALRESEKP